MSCQVACRPPKDMQPQLRDALPLLGCGSCQPELRWAWAPSLASSVLIY